MPRLHLLRVFCGDDGSGGNPLAVFLDGGEIPEAAERQAVAADLGLSEAVFVDDAETGAIRIFTPAVELGFAGHPTVGTAWLLRRQRGPVAALRPTLTAVRKATYGRTPNTFVGRPVNTGRFRAVPGRCGNRPRRRRHR